MVELHPISTPTYIFKKPSDSNCISPSNSTSSPTSLVSPNTPLLPHLIYPNPPPTFHTVQYHPLYFPFPPHPPYCGYAYYPNSHFYPQPVPGVQVACNEPRDGRNPNRIGNRRRIVSVSEKRFTGGGRDQRTNIHGCTSVKKVWKPKESHSSLRVLGDNCTTLMIKNIPNHISRSSLIDMLEIHCRDQNETEEHRFDFVYLPFDFETGKNLGYAFVNFTKMEGASRLYDCWEDKGWEGNSAKIRKITRAKLQGTRRCKKYFQNSEFRCHSEDYLPVLFSPARDGSNGGASSMIIIGTWIFC